MVEVDFFASRIVALPASYSMKYRRLAVGSSIIASGCNLRLSRRGSAVATSFGIRSSFSPSHCDPISKPSAVKPQTVVHPSALPYPKSPRSTAAWPPMLDASCLSLVEALWKTAREDLPALVERLRRLLAEPEP